jgi:hypothetical protein
MRKRILLWTTLIVLLTPILGQARDTPTPAPETPLSAAHLPASIQDLGYRLARYLGVEPDEITLNALQEMSYSDACMGAPLPDEVCAQIVVSPAYSVTFGTPLGAFEFHLDATTAAFRLASPLRMPENQLPVILWQRTGTIAGICRRLLVAGDGRYIVLNCRARMLETAILAQGVLSEGDAAPINDFLMSARALRWSSPVLNISDQVFDTYVAYGSGTALPSEEEQANFNDTLAHLVDRLIGSYTATATPFPVEGDSGIQGQVLLGPICPVERPTAPCTDKPYPATITVFNARGGVVTQFQSDANGFFKVTLLPGSYLLHPQSPNVLPRGEDQTVTVRIGEYALVTIHYDSGIR